MNTPPLLLRIAIKDQDKKGFRFWLPIFLLLPFIYGLYAVCALVIAGFYVLTLRPALMASRLKVLTAFLSLFHSLKGLNIDVAEKKSKVLISIT